jgi:hypothetical protein
MAKKRYRVRKEQLERVVESFVMESAAPEAKKHVKGSVDGKMVEKRSNTKDAPEKDWGLDDEPSHAPEAKKHVKGSESGKMVDKRSNTKVPGKMSHKMKHAPEAKKHVKGSVSESTMELTEEELNEFFGGRKRRKQKLADDFKLKSKLWMKKGVIGQMTRTDFLEFMNAAEEDNYEGKVGLDKENRKIVYRNADDIRWGLPGMQGHTFGSGE